PTRPRGRVSRSRPGARRGARLRPQSAPCPPARLWSAQPFPRAAAVARRRSTRAAPLALNHRGGRRELTESLAPATQGQQEEFQPTPTSRFLQPRAFPAAVRAAWVPPVKRTA